jgi:hypothetical protein
MVKILDPISAQSVAFVADTGSEQQAHLVHFENDAQIRLRRPTQRLIEEDQNKLREMIRRSAAVYVYDVQDRPPHCPLRRNAPSPRSTKPRTRLVPRRRRRRDPRVPDRAPALRPKKSLDVQDRAKKSLDVQDRTKKSLVAKADFDACCEVLPIVMIATTRLLATGRPTVVCLSK